MNLLTQDKLLDETRARVVESAGEVFAEAGFEKATVREICARAHANIAAVNYHFGDKLGLYTEVLKEAACKNKQDVVDEAQALADPEQALRFFIRGIFRKMHEADRPAWYARVMLHELAQPTPALAVVVENLIRPNSRVLCAIVGQILDRPPLDETTRLCAHSIMAQVVHHLHARPVIALLWPDLKATSETLDKIANHITEFSLAALQAFRRKSPHAKRSARRSK
ncbi:MAG TPA: CerR family C-terminal domain-containing protein [Acidobacteriaceae bacterium]|jgi:TetR/AcrR family transcriptional regulator, regulator of cefoperazone and chloramphenicol sensitivity